MTSLALILTYLGCLSSGAMLSMLLLLVASYISGAIWLISHGVIYTGILYVLVYVGAIVVLIMFVVQLTNTNLSSSLDKTSQNKLSLRILQNIILLICLSLLLIIGYSINNPNINLLLSVSNLNLDQSSISMNFNQDLLSNTNNNQVLPLLASSIFNEYGYILVLSVHAIILAVIGPIKLALADI